MRTTGGDMTVGKCFEYAVANKCSYFGVEYGGFKTPIALTQSVSIGG
jgi:hypothetical protein